MKNKFLWALVLLALAGLACNLPFGGGEAEVRFPDAETDTFKVAVRDDSVLEPVPLSASQRQVLTATGAPNRFMILFSEEMREETWYYDRLGYQVTFRNGEVFTEGDTDAAADTVTFVSVYYPWQFNGQMGLSELLTVSGSESFGVESLEEAFQEDVSLVYLKGLDAGFREDQLLYIRAIPVGEGARDLPIMAEPAEPAAQPASGAGLTEVEQANAGTHTYQFTCTYSDGSSESMDDGATWEFAADGVYYDGEGPFPKVSENYYGVQDEYGSYFILFTKVGVIITGDFIETDGQGNDSSITFSCNLTLE